MQTTFNEANSDAIFEALGAGNNLFAARFPGESSERQPVHTVYGGANLFKAASAKKLGGVALRSLAAFAPDFTALARALDFDGAGTLPTDPDEARALGERIAADPEAARREQHDAWLAYTVYERVKHKLEAEPIEDFRIDFEDGYGVRPDEEEDATAIAAAEQVALGMEEGTLPPFIGIRIKPLNEEMGHRAARTLDLFCTTLAAKTGGELPSGFCVTLPKVTVPEQVTALVKMCELLEAETAIRAGHYTALCSITAAYQGMGHPACDFAKHVMQVSMAGTGVWLSDGATTVMPVTPHRAPKDGPPLTPEQQEANRRAVHHAWKVAYDDARHSLRHAYYQGWDLHPAQLVTRYAACYAFFLENLGDASERLTNFIGKAAQATLSGFVFDDAATGQGLLNYFLRALNCGAIGEDEVVATGLTVDEVHGRSFAKIVEARR
jgi:hypothetical protein